MTHQLTTLLKQEPTAASLDQLLQLLDETTCEICGDMKVDARDLASIKSYGMCRSCKDDENCPLQ